MSSIRENIYCRKRIVWVSFQISNGNQQSCDVFNLLCATFVWSKEQYSPISFWEQGSPKHQHWLTWYSSKTPQVSYSVNIFKTLWRHSSFFRNAHVWVLDNIHSSCSYVRKILAILTLKSVLLRKQVKTLHDVTWGTIIFPIIQTVFQQTTAHSSVC